MDEAQTSRRGRRNKTENPAEQPTTASQADATPAIDVTPEARIETKTNARIKAEQSDYTPQYDPPTRRSSESRANAFNPLAWMVEGATGVVEEVRHSDLGLSEEFWVHLYAMRREGLLAARAAVNSLLEKFERERPTTPEQTKRQTRRGEVTIEISKP
jgi:hypothetical protein